MLVSGCLRISLIFCVSLCVKVLIIIGPVAKEHQANKNIKQKYNVMSVLDMAEEEGCSGLDMCAKEREYKKTSKKDKRLEEIRTRGRAKHR